jgi:hypothetical protein
LRKVDLETVEEVGKRACEEKKGKPYFKKNDGLALDFYLDFLILLQRFFIFSIIKRSEHGS